MHLISAPNLILIWAIIMAQEVSPSTIRESIDNEVYSVKRSKEECSIFTYTAMQPLLEYIRELRTILANTDNKSKDNKIVELQNTINQLEQNALESNRNVEVIKANNARITDLEGQLDFQKIINGVLSNLLSKAVDNQLQRSEINKLAEYQCETFKANTTQIINDKQDTIDELTVQLNQIKNPIVLESVSRGLASYDYSYD